MVPSWLVTQVLIGVARFLPTQKLVPSQDLGDLAVRDTKKKKLMAYNVISYKHKPRLQTAVELLNATKEIEGLLEKVLETPLHLPPWNAYASSPDLWVGDQLSQMVPTWSMECEEFHLDFVDPGIFPLSFLSTSFWRCLDTFLSYIRWQQGKCTAACFV